MGWRRPTGFLLVVIALSFVASTAAAQSLRDRLNTARERLAELGADSYADIAAAREIERARIDIDEAADRIANHREELAEVSVIRLEHRVVLIEALIEQATVEALAEERESAAIEMTRDADQSQVASESADLRRTRLREEVDEIIRQTEGWQ